MTWITRDSPQAAGFLQAGVEASSNFLSLGLDPGNLPDWEGLTTGQQSAFYDPDPDKKFATSGAIRAYGFAVQSVARKKLLESGGGFEVSYEKSGGFFDSSFGGFIERTANPLQISAINVASRQTVDQFERSSEHITIAALAVMTAGSVYYAAGGAAIAAGAAEVGGEVVATEVIASEVAAGELAAEYGAADILAEQIGVETFAYTEAGEAVVSTELAASSAVPAATATSGSAASSILTAAKAASGITSLVGTGLKMASLFAAPKNPGTTAKIYPGTKSPSQIFIWIGLGALFLILSIFLIRR